MPVTRKGGPGRHRFNQAMKDIKTHTLQVGFFESAKYPDGTPVALVAAAHEFGVPSRGLPARPFMRPTIASRKKHWSAYLAKLAANILTGEDTVEAGLEKLGLAVAGDIKKTISKVTEPELKKKTVAAKRRKLVRASGKTNLTKPLIETGVMIASVTHEVHKK